MSAFQIFTLPSQQALDSSARVLAGAKLYFYLTGTSTPTDAYADSELTTPVANPLTADSGGTFAQFFLDPDVTYRILLKNAAGATLQTWDPANETPISLAALIELLNETPTALAIYPRTAAEIAASVTPTNYSYQPYVVERYGAVGDGATDDSAAFQRAIDVAREAGFAIHLSDGKNYLVTSSVVLTGPELDSVSLIGPNPLWHNDIHGAKITGDFDAPLIECSGTGLTDETLARGPMIQDVWLENTNTGSSACLVKADYCSGLRIYNVRGEYKNIGVLSSNETISPRFHEVTLICHDTIADAGYRIHQRNGLWTGGQVYGADYGFDLSGDSGCFRGVNVEFCQVVCRATAIGLALFEGCHFETAQVCFTNASTVPIDHDAAWVDNGSTGTGIAGAVSFVGCFMGFTGDNSNFMVIKTGTSFSYALSLDGCYVTHTNPIIGNSFTPGSSVALPAATRVTVRNTAAGSTGLTIVKPPYDAFSGYVLENWKLPGGIDTNALTIRGGVLDTYTPTWGSAGTQPALGNGTITGHYQQIGNLMLVKIKLTMGSTTTYGTGAYFFSLPVTAAIDAQGAAHAVDTGTGETFGAAKASGGFVAPYTTAGSPYAATAPHTWASTDVLEITVSYFV